MKKNDKSHAKNFSTEYIDDDIKNLLSQRNTQLLTRLFQEINPYLLRVCGANGVYKEHADDVIHETWATFFINIEKFEARSKIRTFVCGILFNKIREYRRLQGKIVYEEDAEKAMGQAFTIDGWWTSAPDDPHKISEMKQAADFIKECMEGLSEQQKSAFVMREVEDESSEDICNILGINVTNLRVLIFRAKDKLRKCLEGKINTEETN